jgi:hypothetical protein
MRQSVVGPTDLGFSRHATGDRLTTQRSEMRTTSERRKGGRVTLEAAIRAVVELFAQGS